MSVQVRRAINTMRSSTIVTMLVLALVSLCRTNAAGIGASNTEECHCTNEIPKHYEELGCKGVVDDGQCCPQRYECPDFSKYPKDKCMLKGEAHDLRSSLPNKGCSIGCHCQMMSDSPSFECAAVDCPYQTFDEPAEDCVQQHNLNDCCAESICGDAAKALATCEYMGKKYMQGSYIETDNKCAECICDAKWDNSTSLAVNPNCRRVDCGVELRSLPQIRRGCAPVYFGDSVCCPIEYRCPKHTDHVMPYEGRTDSPSGDDAKKMCVYNAMPLLIGQSLNSDDKCVTCTCRTPPMVDCVRRPGC